MLMVTEVTGAGQEFLFMAVQFWKCAVSGSFLVTATRRPLVRFGSTFTCSTSQLAHKSDPDFIAGFYYGTRTGSVFSTVKGWINSHLLATNQINYLVRHTFKKTFFLKSIILTQTLPSRPARDWNTRRVEVGFLFLAAAEIFSVKYSILIPCSWCDLSVSGLRISRFGSAGMGEQVHKVT